MKYEDQALELELEIAEMVREGCSPPRVLVRLEHLAFLYERIASSPGQISDYESVEEFLADQDPKKDLAQMPPGYRLFTHDDFVKGWVPNREDEDVD